MQEVSQARASGLFGMLMTYAYSLSLILVLLTGVLFLAKDWYRQFISTKILVLIYIINFVGLYFTYTRGAWLGLLFGIPFLFLFYSKKIFTVVALLAGVLGYFSYNHVVNERGGIYLTPIM